jgi:Chaperone of endosialidase
MPDSWNPYNWVADNPDWSLHGAHNWFVGGDATKDIPKQLSGFDQAQASLQGLSQQQAPQIGGTQLAGDQTGQSRGGLMGTADSLGRIASGQQAGAGELAVNRQMGAANAQQASLARQAHGTNSALAYRNAARMTADQGLQGAGAAAQAQMQDQQAANALRGQLYGQAYNQDATVAQQNAQLGQQAQLANQQATLQNRALQTQALGQQLGWSQAQIDEQIKRGAIESADKGIVGGLFGGVGGALSSISDERTKTDVRDGDEDADELMANLKPKTYRYLDKHAKKWGEGERLGIMAQDLARSKMGAKAIVVADDDGHLGFDLGKATSAALASVARLDKRLRALEGKGGDKFELGKLAAGAR